MDPLFNIREVCKQLALLEDHLLHPDKRCEDCIRKHLLTTEALLEEAISLNVSGGASVPLTKLVREVRVLWQNFNDGKDCHVIAEFCRKIRKSLMPAASRLRVASAVRVANMYLGSEQRYKYPRTFHLPWSQGATSDDKILTSTAQFEGKTVVVTEKLDGENCTIGQNYTHARSMDSAGHSSRDWVKGWASGFQFDIPDGWRLCGENLYAKHSIYYEELPSYFLLFSIWDDRNVCLSWKDTVEYAKLLGVHTVPVLYRGKWDPDRIAALWDGRSKFGGVGEGYVVRNAGSFHYSQFSKNLAKFVRSEHVQTGEHWMQQKVVPNKLIKKSG